MSVALFSSPQRKSRMFSGFSVRPFVLPPGFSLVEVVVALGLTGFVLVALFGLLGTGLQGVDDSERQIEAANAALNLVETRLAAPGQPVPGSALPALDLAALPTSAAGALTRGGGVNATGEATGADPRFRLSYRIWRDVSASTNSRLVRIHVALSWPYGASSPANRYELLSSAYLAP